MEPALSARWLKESDLEYNSIPRDNRLSKRPQKWRAGETGLLESQYIAVSVIHLKYHLFLYHASKISAIFKLDISS